MKKEREFDYLKKAQAVYADFPKSEPVLSESPDFLFCEGSKLLGIEILDYIRPMTSRAITLRTIENLHSNVAQSAKAKFESKHNAALHVHLHWHNRFKFTKRNVHDIASQLAALIESDIPMEKYDGTIFDSKLHDDFPI